MKPKAIEQLGLGFLRRVPKQAVTNYLSTSGIGIGLDSPLNLLLGQEQRCEFEIGKGVSKALLALSNPLGCIKQQIILANQIVEITVFVCRVESGENRLIGFWCEEDDIVLTGFWTTSNLISSVEGSLSPQTAGRASNFSWQLTKSGCLALFSLVDCIRNVYFHSLIARKGLDGIRVRITDLIETFNQNTNQPDNRWTLSLIGLAAPELIAANHLYLQVGMQELVDSGLAMRSDDDPQTFYPTEGVLVLVKELLLPLPAVSLCTMKFDSQVNAKSQLLIRGNAFWALNVERQGKGDPIIQLQNLDAKNCLETLANHLESTLI